MDKLQRYKDQVAKERKAAMSNRNDYQKRIANLESELSTAQGEIDEERKYSRCLLDQRDKLQAEKERLREFNECFAAQPGETTLECRHDDLCPYCQFQQLKKLVEELESQKCLKHCCERMTFAV